MRKPARACFAVIPLVLTAPDVLAIEIVGARAMGMAGARVASGGGASEFLLCPAAAGSPTGLGASLWWGVEAVDGLKDPINEIRAARESAAFSPSRIRELLLELSAGSSSARGGQAYGGSARLPGLLAGVGVALGRVISWEVCAIDLDTANVSAHNIDSNESILGLRGSHLGQASIALSRRLGAGAPGELSLGCQLRYIAGRALTDTISIWEATAEGRKWGASGEEAGSASAICVDFGMRVRADPFALGVAARNVNEPLLRWSGDGPPDRRLERSLVAAAAVHALGGMLVEVDAELEGERVGFAREKWVAVGAELPVVEVLTLRGGGRRRRDEEVWLLGLGAGVSFGPVAIDVALSGRPSGGLEDVGGAAQVELAL